MKSKQILSLSLAACLMIGIVKNKNDCLYRQDKDIEG